MAEFQVHIVDDDATVLESVRWILAEDGIEVCAYQSAEQFIMDCPSQNGACLLLDMRMPRMTGIGLLDWMKENYIDMPVVILSGHGDVPAVVDSMRHGAIDFLEKPVDPVRLKQLIGRLRDLSQDQIVAKAKIQQIRDRFCRLTEREKELLELIARGLSSKEIAIHCGISFKTVQNHRASLLAKMHAVNVASLVQMKMLIAEPLSKPELNRLAS